MATTFEVELVAPDRIVWSGEADIVIARTTDGDIGILPNHEPMLAVLVEHPVTIRRTDGDALVAAVLGGFLSQNLFVAEQFTGQPGSFVPIAETIDSFKRLTEGEFDDYPEQAFFLCGGLEDVEEKAKKLRDE